MAKTPLRTRPSWKRLGRALAGLRWWRGTTLEEIYAKTGLRPSSVSDYESGKAIPTPPVLRRLLHALDQSPENLHATCHWLDRLGRPRAPSHSLMELQRAEWALQRSGRAGDLLERLAAHLSELEPPESVHPPRVTPAPGDREHARALRQRLAGHPETGWEHLFQWAQNFRHAGLCALLAEESVELAGQDPDRALGIAQQALALAGMLPGDRRLAQRARGFAGFCVANAWRAKGQLIPAREARAKAEPAWSRGHGSDTAELFPEVRVLALRAVFLRSEEQYADALALYEQALRLAGPADRPALWIGKALTLKEQGFPAAALDLLAAAGREVDPGDLRLQLAVGFNRAVLLGHLDRHAEARELLPGLRERADRLGFVLVRAQLDWLEARVARGLGEMELAVTAFERARRGFAARAVACNEALVTLELAQVLAATGQAAEARQLARGLVDVFEDQGLPSRAFAALRLAS